MYTLGIPFIFLKQNNKNKYYSFISSFRFIIMVFVNVLAVLMIFVMSH